jgi:hypothetical protein
LFRCIPTQVANQGVRKIQFLIAVNRMGSIVNQSPSDQIIVLHDDAGFWTKAPDF